MTKVHLQNGVIFEVPETIVLALGSLLSKHMAEEFEHIDELPAEQFTANHFLAYLDMVKQHMQKPYEGPVSKDPFGKLFKDMTSRDLLAFCEIAFYYNHDRLRDLSVYLMAQRLEKHSEQELRDMMDLADDLTEEEKQAISKENAWILKMYRSTEGNKRRL